MIRSVLFDLDGTLLPFHMDEFMRAYFSHLGKKVAHVMEPKQFMKQLLASTGAMIANGDGKQTNQQVFFKHFFTTVDLAEEVLLPIMNEFYENEFSLLQEVTKRDTAARVAVNTALSSGLDVVVATNPIFPLVATQQRLEWAGLGDITFKLITTYENSHFCKPNTQYYEEIVGKLGCQPNECLMVGNDVEEDLAAAKIGMKTYLVTDCLINAKEIDFIADYTGTLKELSENLGEIIKKM
ncbi:HAD family hydrolase [Pelosinus propionicus]|uniref:Haloacid dehalogenase superfamily, subfamily IA, variant 1 with third motif having Dx(3-4)D or Dx(3-4)E n=1 Tax=Pelosinus propionicus DSM 13327 TaxID=1123291 RepID=A0A1I4NP76_9FIRM|nr:HAD family hydrolase [Pelosinus propionicus]SFM17352.1 haloacid dehalogenase superfamily, subfamily IA, variant 1 with third motif having Dx(3-4)D or Dx(3-4)E [Pelosinus propionicus DSM 13327]